MNSGCNLDLNSAYCSQMIRRMLMWLQEHSAWFQAFKMFFDALRLLYYLSDGRECAYTIPIAALLCNINEHSLPFLHSLGRSLIPKISI